MSGYSDCSIISIVQSEEYFTAITFKHQPYSRQSTSSVFDPTLYRPTVDWPLKLPFTHDKACGRNCLHSLQPPVIHSDLKSRNVLISDRLVAKITSEFCLSVCPSVCQTLWLWQNEIIICWSFSTIWRSDISSFLRPNFVILSLGVHPKQVG